MAPPPSLLTLCSFFHPWFRFVLSRALRSEIRVSAAAASFSLLPPPQEGGAGNNRRNGLLAHAMNTKEARLN